MSSVTFLHPDLGIGGAERLVVDAALGLKSLGYKVRIVTTHHDPSRAFEETVNGEVDVTVVGDWLPRSFFNRFYALMAYIRILYAALYILLFSSVKTDIVFCDLVSVAVPILKIRYYVIFYCHYPDQLLSKPEGRLKALYRAPLNWLEEVSMGMANKIFVNSQYTAGVFRQTFKKLSGHNVSVLYPSLNMKYFDSFSEMCLPSDVSNKLKENDICFLSINRYERKKNLQLALHALNELRKEITESEWKNIRLIMVGGYDPRVIENIEYLEELKECVNELNLNPNVTFLTSITDLEKISLLKACTCLLYTPSNEHFGIVPIEAMYLGKPVIAVNSGGPVESIVTGKTGFLCSPTPIAFAEAMKKFVSDKTLSITFGAAGRKRVSSEFSFTQFSFQLDLAIINLIDKCKNF